VRSTLTLKLTAARTIGAAARTTQDSGPILADGYSVLTAFAKPFGPSPPFAPGAPLLSAMAPGAPPAPGVPGIPSVVVVAESMVGASPA
jgi:hypothetical protein